MSSVSHFEIHQGRSADLFERLAGYQRRDTGEALGEPHPLPYDIRRDYRWVIRDVRVRNTDWAENRFGILRGAKGGNWSIDGMAVRQDGGGILKSWSTYETYFSGKPTPPTLEELAKESVNLGKLVIPLTPKNDIVYFWLAKHESDLRVFFEQELGRPITVEAYPTSPAVKLQVPDQIEMTRIPRETRIGVTRAGEQGVHVGQLGFWALNKKAEDPQKYLPRGYFKKSSILENFVLFSPRSKVQIVLEGGVPMDERHRKVDFETVPEQFVNADFIAGALVTAEQRFQDPVALVYTAYRPWMGESPHMERDFNF